MTNISTACTFDFTFEIKSSEYSATSAFNLLEQCGIGNMRHVCHNLSHYSFTSCGLKTSVGLHRVVAADYRHDIHSELKFMDIFT
jgi:hypothetical protein